MKPIYVIGIDVGLANMGVVKAELLPQGFAIVDAFVISTEKSDKKREVKVADDNIRRVMELVDKLYPVFDDDVIAICAEALSLPRNASAASKISLAFGAMATIATINNIPILQSSPQEVKKATVGTKSASKTEMIAAIKQRFPKMKWPKKTTLHEHQADATASIVSCLNHPVLVSAKKIMKDCDVSPPELKIVPFPAKS